MQYEAVLGPNTNQWWAYDNENDKYIDPPVDVLDSLPDWRDQYEDAENDFQHILDKNPSWLKDKDYIYDAEELEI